MTKNRPGAAASGISRGRRALAFILITAWAVRTFAIEK
jgi:hypothetical protein